MSPPGNVDFNQYGFDFKPYRRKSLNEFVDRTYALAEYEEAGDDRYNKMV